MKFVALIVAFLLPNPLMAAAGFPALYDVTGVAGSDVLYVRQAPDAASPALGSLPAKGQDIEGVGISADGKWVQINLEEQSGWVQRAF